MKEESEKENVQITCNEDNNETTLGKHVQQIKINNWN